MRRLFILGFMHKTRETGTSQTPKGTSQSPNDGKVQRSLGGPREEYGQLNN